MKQSNAFDTFKLTNKEKSIYYMSLIIQIYLIYSILTNDEHPNNKFAPPSDLFEEIEEQKELENEKLQAEIQSIKINNIKILNEIQTNEELLKLVDEELNKTVAEVVGIDEKKGD